MVENLPLKWAKTNVSQDYFNPRKRPNIILPTFMLKATSRDCYKVKKVNPFSPHLHFSAVTSVQRSTPTTCFHLL